MEYRNSFDGQIEHRRKIDQGAIAREARYRPLTHSVTDNGIQGGQREAIEGDWISVIERLADSVKLPGGIAGKGWTRPSEAFTGDDGSFQPTGENILELANAYGRKVSKSNFAWNADDVTGAICVALWACVSPNGKLPALKDNTMSLKLARAIAKRTMIDQFRKQFTVQKHGASVEIVTLGDALADARVDIAAQVERQSEASERLEKLPAHIRLIADKMRAAWETGERYNPTARERKALQRFRVAAQSL